MATAMSVHQWQCLAKTLAQSAVTDSQLVHFAVLWHYSLRNSCQTQLSATACEVSLQRLSELSKLTQLITWRHAWLTKKTHLGKAALTQIIRLCMRLPGHLGSQSTCPCRKLLPVVVFVFSRKRIDQTADNLNSLDLTSASEKAEIHIFVEQSVSRLKGGDRRLPQIIRLKQMLKRGLGVHHAGLSLLQSNPTQFNSIQFNSIQFNSIQFNSIQFNSIQSNSIQFNSIQFNSIQLQS